jgi:cardiolipin synthase
MSLRWLPNAICVVRILLVYPIVSFLLAGQYELTLILIVVAGASDGLDGFLAKTFDWRTRLGGLLDPIADKLLVTSVFLTLTYLGSVPIGLAVVVVLRDVVIVLGAVVYQVLIAPVRARPTRISKLNTACQLAFMVFTLTQLAFGWPPAISLMVLGAAVVFTSITSGMNYVLHWSRLAYQTRHAAGGAA